MFGRSTRVIQSESAECGLACLAMIAQHHGHQVSLRTLRERFPASQKGARLGDLIAVAGRLGLGARALRLEIDDLPQLATPCVLHWDLTHFVVLLEARGGKVRIADPACGERQVTLAEASRKFTGVALELTPEVNFEKREPEPSVSVRQLTGPVTGLWRALGLLLVLSLALQVFTLVAPFFMQLVVDNALVSGDRNLLVVLGLGFGALVVFQGLTSLLRGWSIIFLSTRLSIQWTGNVFAHLVKLPLDFFAKRHVGDVVSRMSAVQSIQQTVTSTAVEAVIDGMMALATLTMMLIYSPRLALVTLGAVLLYFLVRWGLYLPMRDRTERQLLASAKSQSHLLETIRGMLAIKVAGRESTRQSVYQNLVVDAVNEDRGLGHLNLGFVTTSQLIFGIERIAVIWIGATLAMDNVFSVGMLIAYLAYKDQFTSRINGLIDKLIEFRMLRLHGERLADVVLTKPEMDEGLDPGTPPPADAGLEVRDLSFRYAEGEPWIFRNCSFRIRDGESVAIVGVSGCGKTTLAKVLLGLLPATEGAVLMGGQDIRRIGLRNYRALTAAVMQDDQLFAGSVAENIAFGGDGHDQADVEAAAKMAAVHDEIVAMPMGYHSLIGDMGTSLSGGQKQRIVLARALYRKPRIAILDEATSHLDVHGEKLVNDAVRQLKLTRIIIAHRPETIASADRVFAMHAGMLLELPVQPAVAPVATADTGEEPQAVES